MAKNSDKNMGLITNKDKLTVLKSRPLYALWDTDLTLQEFKILDTYLGRIDSHNEENRTVKFEKGKLEEILGVKQIKPKELDKRIEHLMTTIRIPDDDSPRGYYRIALFEEAHLVQDEFGLWECELTCTQKARKYVFNIDNIGYIRYKLQNVINLKSRYSYFMYLYVWDNKRWGTWDVPLGELKTILNCDKEETYRDFRYFNVKILKRTHDEIHRETNIRYEYETIKRGRTVVGIRFTYLGMVQEEEEELSEVEKNQISMDDWLEAEAHREEEPVNLAEVAKNTWKNSIPEGWLTPEELSLIEEKLYQIPEHKLPPLRNQYESITDQRETYIREVVKKTIVYKAKNKFNYILSIINKDIKE